MKVQSNGLIAKDTYCLVFEEKLQAKPGQFIAIQIDGHTLRRPISISRIHEDRFEIIYKIKGKGTSDLSKVQPGSFLEVLAPLGNGFTLVEGKKVLLVGGGIGTPPLLELYHQLQKKNHSVELLVGLNDLEENAYEDYSPRVATIKGESEFVGNVIEYLKTIPVEYDYVYACGPMGMLKALEKHVSVDGQISIEERMGCGFGACRGCTCKTKENKHKRICVEGPVFKIGEVNFDEHEN